LRLRVIEYYSELPAMGRSAPGSRRRA